MPRARKFSFIIDIQYRSGRCCTALPHCLEILPLWAPLGSEHDAVLQIYYVYVYCSFFCIGRQFTFFFSITSIVNSSYLEYCF